MPADDRRGDAHQRRHVPHLFAERPHAGAALPRRPPVVAIGGHGLRQTQQVVLELAELRREQMCGGVQGRHARAF